jgi:Coenzyme PQQ synthesis protein D (PqqD)
VHGTAIITRSPSALTERLEGELLVLDPANDRFVRLNASGGALWEALERPRSLDELVDELCARFGLARERALPDAEAFVGGLAERGLVTVSPS